MHVRRLALSSVLVSASWLALGVSAPAFALCDSYSGGCAPGRAPVGTPIQGGADAPATGGGTDAPAADKQPAGAATRPLRGGTGQPATGGGTTDAPAVSEGATLGGGAQQPATGGRGAGTSTAPATLPFTGGELVLLTALGAGALAGGTALVVAGRRRAQTA